MHLVRVRASYVARARVGVRARARARVRARVRVRVRVRVEQCTDADLEESLARVGLSEAQDTVDRGRGRARRLAPAGRAPGQG